MSEKEAKWVLAGILPMPENVTIESVFAAAHITPRPVTPF